VQNLSSTSNDVNVITGQTDQSTACTQCRLITAACGDNIMPQTRELLITVFKTRPKDHW